MIALIIGMGVLLGVAMALHEAGHAICALALGCEVGLFFRFPWALGISAMTTSQGQIRLIAAAGPATSIIGGLAIILAAYCLGYVAFGSVVGLFSIAVGISQLVPIKGFDGGHIFRSHGR